MEMKIDFGKTEEYIQRAQTHFEHQRLAGVSPREMVLLFITSMRMMLHRPPTFKEVQKGIKKYGVTLSLNMQGHLMAGIYDSREVYRTKVIEDFKGLLKEAESRVGGLPKGWKRGPVVPAKYPSPFTGTTYTSNTTDNTDWTLPVGEAICYPDGRTIARTITSPASVVKIIFDNVANGRGG